MQTLGSYSKEAAATLIGARQRRRRQRFILLQIQYREP
jgi:hypothetical protein